MFTRIKVRKIRQLTGWLWVCLSLLLLTIDSRADTVCAQVKIEIKQELTLERQAFDAMMRISNGLDNLPINNVNIHVNFEDEEGNSILASSDPNNTAAKFFIRVDSMDNISDVNGYGSVSPSTAAEIHWLIIPAPGAAEGSPSGKLYFVGATLDYTLGGEPETISVTPDFITVKPLPLLTLDYFLTRDVNADDPLTPVIEPIEPYTLGVRVLNSGVAEARNLKIDSAQPKIIENEQGLLIGFEILGSSVDDKPVAPTLLIDFDTIPGNSSKVGRWQLISTLSGQFVEFTATFSHADELGGALTSILDAANTHFLVRDVRVDLPGRDAVRDFLAQDGDVLRVYESDSVDTVTVDRSTEANLALQNQSGTLMNYQLTYPVTDGFSFIKLPDPHAGRKAIVRVVRSDGKLISTDNAWLSKSRNRNTSPMSWDHSINLFDANTTGVYIIQMDDAVSGPVAPVLQYIPERTTHEGAQIGFLVEASDANGGIPALSAAPLPTGAVFVDNGDGTAFFNWTPAVGQAGRYNITYTASDGVLSSSRSAVIQVNSLSDTDGDGMDDAWELEHFGTLDRDGSGDLDGDGISDLDEFLAGTDPANGPLLPVIESPLYDTEVSTLEPALTIRNVPHGEELIINYSFELYADAEMTQLVVERTGVVEGEDGTTAWTPSEALVDNTAYTWRVRSYDGVIYSEWVEGRFFVNTENDPPGTLTVSTPVDGSEVDRLNPLLAVNNAQDPDRDLITYGFEVSAFDDLSSPVAIVEDLQPGLGGATGWVVDPPLLEDSYYYWRARVTDEHGIVTLGPLSSFFVNTANQAPTLPLMVSPVEGEVLIEPQALLTVQNATDQDNDAIVYLFEIDTVETFDSDGLRESGPIVETDAQTRWLVEGLVEDTTYFWRVKASDGAAESDWAVNNFTINSSNSPPPVPVIQNPGLGSWVATLQPTLSVNQSIDPDGDEVSYRFELYGDPDLTLLLEDHVTTETNQQLETPLSDNKWYFWRVRAEDNHEEISDWTTMNYFFVDDNGINDPPTFEFILPNHNLNAPALVTVKWRDYDPDNNANISFYYDTDDSGADGTLISDAILEDPDGMLDKYYWQKAVAPGRYWIYAVIDDGNTSVTVYSDYSVTIGPGYPKLTISGPHIWP
jgi:hypothetical protein